VAEQTLTQVFPLTQRVFAREGEFESILNSEFVVGDAKVVPNDAFRGPDGFSNFAVCESLRGGFAMALLSFA
jgi:hypothetical protein